MWKVSTRQYGETAGAGSGGVGKRDNLVERGIGGRSLLTKHLTQGFRVGLANTGGAARGWEWAREKWSVEGTECQQRGKKKFGMKTSMHD